VLPVFFLPEKLLKYVVRDQFIDGGTRYKPADLLLGAGFFYWSRPAVLQLYGIKVCIGLLETL